MSLKSCLTVLTIAVSINVLGQARVDNQRKYTVLASSPVVTNFVGWSYDSSKEKWAGYYNTIWDSYRGNNKTPIRTSAANMAKQNNIVSLQVKKISYQENVYYAIIYTSWTGYYDYPSISEGWHPYKHHCLLVYDVNEYMKLFSLNIGSSPTIIGTYGKTFEYATTEKSVNGLLNYYFDGTELKKDSYNQKFMKFKQEDSNTIRLAGPTTFKNWPEHFSKEYYEIKMTTFKTLFIK